MLIKRYLLLLKSALSCFNDFFNIRLSERQVVVICHEISSFKANPSFWNANGKDSTLFAFLTAFLMKR